MMKHFTPEQQNRYEAYRRSAFGKNGIKKVRTHARTCNNKRVLVPASTSAYRARLTS